MRSLSLLCALVGLVTWSGSSGAQVAAPQPVTPVQAPQRPTGPERTARLEATHRTLLALEGRLERERAALKASDDKAAAERHREQMAVLDKRLSSARASFDALAADVTLDGLVTDVQRGPRDVLSEVQDLLGPVLDAFRRMSARPRRIEQLRSDIESLRGRMAVAAGAMQNIDSLLHFHGDRAWAGRLREARTRVEGISAELEIRLGDRERKLREELGSEESLVETLRTSASAFVRTKGKNILVATLVFLLVLLASLALRRRLLELSLVTERLVWLRKPLAALYGLIAACAAILAAVLTFYALHDMLLFTLTLLFMSLAVWSFKHLLPKYFQELRLILNLGTVREGERVQWQGLPWRVEKLGLRSTLVNEDLEGGQFQVAAAELIGKHSRAIVEGEPWFPCKVGEWVMLPGNYYGQVVRQTPEQVIVRDKGFMPKFIATRDFLSQQPQNFSGGYFIWFELALDHSLVADIAGKVAQQVQQGMASRVADLLEGDNPVFEWLQTDYSHATESALVLLVQAGVRGDQAPGRGALGRRVRRAALEACVEHGLPLASNRLFDRSGAGS